MNLFDAVTVFVNLFTLSLGGAAHRDHWEQGRKGLAWFFFIAGVIVPAVSITATLVRVTQ